MARGSDASPLRVLVLHPAAVVGATAANTALTVPAMAAAAGSLLTTPDAEAKENTRKEEAGP